MRFWRKNNGFTLVELLVVIAVGSVVSLAATTILLFAMRFYRINLDTVEHQSILRIMLSVVENMSSEGEYSFDINTDQIKKDSSTIISFNSSTKQVVTGTGAVLMEDVDGFDIKKPTSLELYENAAEDLYTFAVQMDGQTFNSTVYSRTKSVVIEERDYAYSVFSYSQENNWEADDPDVDYEAGRDYLVNIAASQIGSGGKIMDYPRGNEGTDYSLWYLNSASYTNGWSASTPWCAVFASWVLNKTAQQGSRYDANDVMIPYLDSIPKEANVNHLWLRLYNGVDMSNFMVNNHSAGAQYICTPKPGDLIFFEFDANEYLEPLKNLSGEFTTVLDLKIQYEKEERYANKEHPYEDQYIILKSTWQGLSAQEQDKYEEYVAIKHYLKCQGEDLDRIGLDHVGIVAKVEDGIVYTIEGNVETHIVGLNETTVVNQVVLRQYALNDEDIFGYATLNWNDAYK